MREWLLKEEEEKNKVGRPRLAREEALKKARISIVVSVVLCFILLISFLSIVKKESPLNIINSFIPIKTFYNKENKEGFIEKNYYDKNSNYVMEMKTTDTVESYQGTYKYTIYKLSNNEWKEVLTKKVDKGSTLFKIKVESKKNKNVTYKVKLQIINSSKIDKSFAPTDWKFVNSDKSASKYAYKVFTVKGYYSPVPYDELKEKKKNKIYIETRKENPRTFILNTVVPVKVNVSYIEQSRKNKLSEVQVEGQHSFEIPELSRFAEVKFKVCGDNLGDKALSTWTVSDDNKCISNTYLLKSEKAYKY